MRKQLNLIQFSRVLVPLFVILLHAKAFMSVYFHYDFLKLSEVTKSGGVYYFFALSGFMVYYLYNKDIGNQKVIKDFLYKRFIRIYPIYWILTLCVLPLYFVLPNLGTGSEREISHIIASFFLFPDGFPPILSVAWSLEHTLFFYLMFSLIFFKNKMISIFVSSIWIILSIVFSFDILTSSNYLIGFLFSFNNLIFLSGVVCAYIVTKIKFNLYLSWLFVIIGAAGFPLSWINIQYSFIDIDLQITTTIASILLILGFSSIDLQKGFQIPKFAKLLGDASFSIYLTHFTSMSAISIVLSSILILPIPNFLLAIILIISSIIFGCLIYIFIEKPIHNRFKKIYSNKRQNLSASKPLYPSNI